MNIYVGNLPKEVSTEELEEAFKAFGQVSSAVIIKDKFSGEPRGFGFVEMPSRTEAEAALNGVKEVKGKAVIVNEARPRVDQRGGGRRDSRNRGGGGPLEFRLFHSGRPSVLQSGTGHDHAGRHKPQTDPTADGSFLERAEKYFPSQHHR